MSKIRKSSQTERILKALYRKSLTAKQIEALGIKNVTARIYDLRNEGFNIVANYGRLRNGDYRAKYQLSVVS